MKFIWFGITIILFASHSLSSANAREASVFTENQITIKDTMIQFASSFSNKDADSISALLADDFSLYDPALKWVHGKQAVVELLKKQFSESNHVAYEVIHVYENGNIGILEFKITLDQLILYGVDFIEFENGKMSELRCYYNPPDLLKNETLKPFSDQAKSLSEGAVYEHYKGNRYRILSVGRHSETLEESVVYQSLSDSNVWIRPLSLFLEKVIVDRETRPRFTHVEEKVL